MNCKKVCFLVFLLFFLINNIFAIEYLDSKDIFNINASEISYDETNGYYLNLSIENFVEESLNYNLEIIYLDNVLVVKSDNFTCEKFCQKQIYLDKVFFGKHNLIINTKYNENFYQKIVSFNLDMPSSNYIVNLNPTYYISNGQINVAGELILNSLTPSVFEFEIFPKTAPNEKQIFKITCDSKCNFEYIINSPVVIDDYVVRIYSIQGDLEKIFKTIYSIVPEEISVKKDEKKTEEKVQESNNEKDKEIEKEKNEIKQNQKEDKFKSYINKNNGKNTSGYFLYDNKGKKGDEIKTKFKKNNLELLPVEVVETETYDIEFEFNSSSSVKKIKIPNTKLDNLSIGVEDVKSNNIVGVPESIVSAFAINPVLPSPIGFFEVNFTATGTALYKCELYDFKKQICYGSYKKLLDTVPGQNYILNLTGVDPLFVNTIANTSNDGRAAAGVFQLNTAPVRFGNVAGVLYDAYFRFDKVAVPPGSQVTNAYLNLSSAAARTTLTVNAKIYGFNDVNCIHFDAPNGGDNPVDNTRTTNFVLWNAVPAWSNGEIGPDTKSPNISIIIQEIIALPSWEVNNSICIVVLNNGSSNNAYRDVRTVGAVNPARLYVDYTNPNAYVMWLPIDLSLNSYAGQSSYSVTNVTSIMNNTNVLITEIGGSGSSFISANMSTLGNLTNNQKVPILFDCSPLSSQAIGIYESIFNVNSTQSPSGINITITCEVTLGPQLNLISPTTTNYINVTEAENIILRFNLTDTNGDLITNYTNILNITLGNTSLNITNYSNLAFNSNFSISSQMTTPQGMTVYGNKMWITSGDRDSVYQYYTNGTYITYYNISAQTTDPRGITTIDGSEFWVVDNGAVAPNDVVIHYDSNFNFIDIFSVATQTANPYGIAYDGTTFYVEDDTVDRILRYNSTGGFLGNFSIAAQTTTPRGITIYENELWLIDLAGNNPDYVILHYYTNGTYIDSFSVQAQTIAPIGVSTVNGKQFFVADTTSDRVLYYRSENTRYNSSGYFEVNITIPSGFADFQNISIYAMTYIDSEFILSDTEINALNFGEKTPPASVTNLENVTQRVNWIFFNWTNPVDLDFSHVQIWFNNSNIANITAPQNYYNFTNLSSNTNYTISTRTVDINGNINTTWVNKTAITTNYPFIQNITPLNNTNYNQSEIITISANVTSSYGINNVSVYVIWESGAESLNMINHGNNIYSVNFTNTVDISAYNFTITAIDNLGVSINSNVLIFNIISNTPFLDTYVRSDTATTSYGTATRIHVSSVGASLRRGMVRFDLSYLPTGIRIDNAMMQLYLATYGGTAITHSIFAINSTWNGTTTWNTQPSILATNWNSTRVTAIGWKAFNITNLSKNWYNGSIINYGVMVKEATEITIGTNQYRSSEAGTLIPSLSINYTDITYPQVTNINSIETAYHLKDNISLKVQVTDNIAVSLVYANISWPTGSERINLTSIGSFQYAANYTTLTYQGPYNITIIANDTTNLINNSLKFYFNTTYLNLKISNNITKISPNNYNVNISLKNINFFKTPESKLLYVNVFVPRNISSNSSFDISNSYKYVTTNESILLSGSVYSGNLYKFTLTPIISTESVFESYTDSFNESNSWQLSFNINGSGNYNISKIIVSVQ